MDALLAVMARLRAPDGCPWDREQTSASLARYTLEEAYEVLDAIERGDPAHLRDELGDPPRKTGKPGVGIRGGGSTLCPGVGCVALHLVKKRTFARGVTAQRRD